MNLYKYKIKTPNFPNIASNTQGPNFLVIDFRYGVILVNELKLNE